MAFLTDIGNTLHNLWNQGSNLVQNDVVHPIQQEAQALPSQLSSVGQYIQQTPQRVQQTIQNTPLLPPQLTQTAQNFAQGFTSPATTTDPRMNALSPQFNVAYNAGNFVGNDLVGGAIHAAQEAAPAGKFALNLGRGAINAAIAAGTMYAANKAAGNKSNPQDYILPAVIGGVTGIAGVKGNPEEEAQAITKATELFTHHLKASPIIGDITRDLKPAEIQNAITNLANRPFTGEPNTDNAIKLATFIDNTKKGLVSNAPPSVGLSVNEVKSGGKKAPGESSQPLSQGATEVSGQLPTPKEIPLGSQPESLGQSPALPTTPNGGEISSGANIPQNMTKVEAKQVASKLGLQGDQTIPTGKKTLGVVDTVQTSGQTTEPLQQEIKGAYNVAGNKETLAAAQQRIAKDPNGAYQFALNNHNAEANATAILLAKQYELNGQADMAANLMMQKAKQALEAGQGNQIYSLWDKLSPETVGQTAAKTIEAYNATAKNKIPALTADQYQYFVNQAKAIQGMTDERQKGIATQNLLTQIGRLIPSSTSNKAVSLWRAGLLTGFRTPGKILVSHGVSNTVEQAKNIPAAAVDMATSLFTGKRSLTPTLRGNIAGFKQGTLDAVDNFVHGYNAPNSGGSSKDFTNQVNFGNGFLGKVAQAYVDGIGRLHGSLYKPFFGAAHMNSLYDQALTEASNQGLAGNARENFVINFVKNPPAAAQQRAIQEAEYTTFQNKTMLGNIASGFSQRGGVLGKVVAPFTQIPSSIAMKLVDYSPVGAVKTVIDQINKGQFDQRAFSQGLGRSITGTGIMAIGAALYNKGMMTLGYPTSPAERALWQQEGKKENSILINGKWRSLASLGPAGDALSVGANYAAGMNGNQKTPGSIANAAINAGTAGAQTIYNAPYLQGLNSLTTSLQDPQKTGMTFAQNYLSSLIPTAVSNIAVSTDPYARQSAKQSGNLTNAITNNIPGLREQNAPQLDVLGNPVPRANDTLGSLIDPFYSSINRQTPITQELQRLNDAGYPASLSPLSKNQTIAGQKQTLTSTQLNALTKQEGPQVGQALQTLINQPDYQSLSDQDKATAIGNVVSQVRKQVRATADVNNPPTVKTGTSNAVSSLNKKFIVVNPDTGAVKTIDLSKPIQAPQLTGNYALDQKLTAGYNSALTTRANDIVTLYKNNKIDAATAEKALEQLAGQKVGSGKSAKRISIARAVMPKAQPIRLQLHTKGKASGKFKLAAAPKIKMASTKVKTGKSATFKVTSPRVYLSTGGGSQRGMRKIAGISVPVRKRVQPHLTI